MAKGALKRRDYNDYDLRSGESVWISVDGVPVYIVKSQFTGELVIVVHKPGDEGELEPRLELSMNELRSMVTTDDAVLIDRFRGE